MSYDSAPRVHLSVDDVEKMAKDIFGYGRWGAPHWFIGLEQGIEQGIRRQGIRRQTGVGLFETSRALKASCRDGARSNWGFVVRREWDFSKRREHLRLAAVMERGLIG